jgi:hypothetical protein
LGAPTSRQSAVEIIAHDGEVEAEKVIHLVLPLEGKSCRAYDQDALGRFATKQTSDEEAGFNRFSQSHVVGKQVTEALRTEDLIEEECLMRQGLNGSFGKAAGGVILAENQARSQFSLEGGRGSPLTSPSIGQRVWHRIEVGWKDIFEVIAVVERNLEALVPEGIFLDVTDNAEAVFRMRTVNNAGVGSQGG